MVSPRIIYDTLRNTILCPRNIVNLPNNLTRHEFFKRVLVARMLFLIVCGASGVIRNRSYGDIFGEGQRTKTILRNTGMRVKFVTNTTKEPLRLLHSRLLSLQFDIKPEEIFTSLTAARELIKDRQLRPLLFVEESAKEDFSGISEEDPNAVVIGLSPEHFNYSPMNKAFRLILDGAPLIAIHKGRYFKKKDGLYLGPGPFVAGLEYATDKKAEVVGKPEKRFFVDAIKDLDCDVHQTVMIGDDARDDIGGALAVGMMGILVKTGKYRQGDEQKLEDKPIGTCPDFPAAVELIINHNSRINH